MHADLRLVPVGLVSHAKVFCIWGEQSWKLLKRLNFGGVWDFLNIALVQAVVKMEAHDFSGPSG